MLPMVDRQPRDPNQLSVVVCGQSQLPAVTRKVFRDSAVEGLKEFFERFKTLNVHSSAQLDELVQTAQKAVQGVAPQDLRDSVALRGQIAQQMTGVLSSLDGLLVDAPRRKLLRPAPPVRQAVA